jgi:pyrroloquinoline quinone (PQQ) biosynthesis protein C
VTNTDHSLDVAGLRERVRSSWASSAVDGAAVAAAAAASAELAARAYQRGDRHARRRAESIIYFLNLDSCFAPPADPLAGVVWTTLMHAKLAELRRDHRAQAGAGEVSAADLPGLLEAAVARWGAHAHPLLGELEGNGSLAAYRIWAKNWFGSCHGFSLQLASLVQRTTGAAKKAVLENLNDEFADDATHDSLRIRFYEKIGLHHSPEAVFEDPDWVLEAAELLNLRTGLCNLSDPMPALGCFYGVEANWPPECRRHHALHKRAGLDDHTLEYWTTHAFADEHHADEWLQSVVGLCRTDAQRAAVVEGAVIQLRLRWRMYDAIRDRIAAEAGAPSARAASRA